MPYMRLFEELFNLLIIVSEYKKIFIQNGFGTNNNKDYYNYIITEIYDLHFKKNIEKNINKKINHIYKKDKLYADFKEYFKASWVN